MEIEISISASLIDADELEIISYLLVIWRTLGKYFRSMQLALMND